MKIKSLTERAMTKDFPDNWHSIAAMRGLKIADVDEGKITLYAGESDELTITRDCGIDTSFTLPDDVVRDIIIAAAELNNKEKL